MARMHPPELHAADGDNRAERKLFEALRSSLPEPWEAFHSIDWLERDPDEGARVGGGYIVEALEAALWALWSTGTFEDGVLAAVNLGDDADTTAAIYGQLAGALYGAEAIPARWRERVHMGEQIVALADGLYELAASGDASRQAGSTSAARPNRGGR